jgi:hypothetical protein
MLRSVKDYLGLKTAGIYQIKCGKVYVGQIGKTVQELVKEQQIHLTSTGINRL